MYEGMGQRGEYAAYGFLYQYSAYREVDISCIELVQAAVLRENIMIEY